MKEYESYTSTVYDSSKKQNVITSDNTITHGHGDGLPWYYKPFVDKFLDCELQKK